MRLSKTILVFGRQEKEEGTIFWTCLFQIGQSCPCWMLSKIMVVYYSLGLPHCMSPFAISAVFWQNCIVCSLGKTREQVRLSGLVGIIWLASLFFGLFVICSHFSQLFSRKILSISLVWRGISNCLPCLLWSCWLVLFFPICPSSKRGWSKGISTSR